MTGTTSHGRCHCGQTEWTVTLDNAAHVLCHCQACKLLSGGEATLNQIVPASGLTITKGKDSLGRYTYRGDSGQDVHCFYCPNCTSHAYHHQTVMGPDRYVVRTGLLHGAELWAPVAEVYGKDRAKWMPELAHTFEKGPE
ncbi:MAG: hypothetical protein M1826_004366 [Phylliscum demangeonii]|nr:MAG: hypothetical protein M1826_004366 [Phylliscum demangeonii]